MENRKNIFDVSMEEIRRQCNTKNVEGDLTQVPIVPGETLEPCIRGAKKIFEDPETLKIVKEVLSGSIEEYRDSDIDRFHTTLIPFDDENLSMNEIKIQYDIQDDEVVFRLWDIKTAIKKDMKKNLSLEELILFLKNAMNYDDMQLFLMSAQIEGIELGLNDKLKKFFELKSKEEILKLYNVEQNYNQNNIGAIQKIMDKNI